MANSEVDAGAIATRAFDANDGVDFTKDSPVWGKTLGNITVTDLTISREIF